MKPYAVCGKSSYQAEEFENFEIGFVEWDDIRVKSLLNQRQNDYDVVFKNVSYIYCSCFLRCLVQEDFLFDVVGFILVEGSKGNLLGISKLALRHFGGE